MLHLLTAFYAQPWAIEPAAFAAIEAVLLRHAAGQRLTAEQIAAAVGDAPQIAAARRDDVRSRSGGGLQVIPVHGVLTPRDYQVGASSRPLTSTEALAREFAAAAADPRVGAVVLDVDSPGGAVSGTVEAADALWALRQSGKRVIAVSNHMAASAAYWIASQATEVIVAPSASVGSIGVIAEHRDLSAAYEQAGIRRTYVTYGKYKSEGHDGAPLEDDARAHLQEVVDEAGAQFTRAVARGRKHADVSIEQVRGAEFGQGRMKDARQAVAARMADRIGTLDDVVAHELRLLQRNASRSGAAAERDIQILEA